MRIVAFCCGLFAFMLSCLIVHAQVLKSPPEAAPIIAILAAVNGSDVAEFKNAYARRIRDDKVQGDWGGNLKQAQANMQKLFGNYQLNKFSYTFVGNREIGKVTLTDNGKEAFSLNVIKERGKWKVDQR